MVRPAGRFVQDKAEEPPRKAEPIASADSKPAAEPKAANAARGQASRQTGSDGPK